MTLLKSKYTITHLSLINTLLGYSCLTMSSWCTTATICWFIAV